jgi:hypothetical protein
VSGVGSVLRVLAEQCIGRYHLRPAAVQLQRCHYRLHPASFRCASSPSLASVLDGLQARARSPAAYWVGATVTWYMRG